MFCNECFHEAKPCLSAIPLDYLDCLMKMHQRESEFNCFRFILCLLRETEFDVQPKAEDF